MLNFDAEKNKSLKFFQGNKTNSLGRKKKNQSVAQFLLIEKILHHCQILYGLISSVFEKVLYVAEWFCLKIMLP